MRRNIVPTVVLVLNISQAARALCLRTEHIRQFILEGRLICRQFGNRRMIAIGGEGGLQNLIESFPLAKPTIKKG